MNRLDVIPICLLVLVVPLVYWPDVYDCDLAPKLFAIHLGLVLACLTWLLRTRGGRDARPAGGPLLLPLTALLGVALLSAPAAPMEAVVELFNQAALLVLFVLTASVFSPERTAPLLWANAAGGGIVALVGILQYHGLAFRGIPSAALPSATFGNRNCAAMYLVCAAPLSGLLFLTVRRRAAAILAGLSTTLTLVFLVYTRTRSAWVGLAGALLTVAAALTLSPGLRRPVMEALRARMARDRRAWAWGFLTLFLLLAALPPARPAAIRGQDLPGQKTGVLPTAMSIFHRDEADEGDISKESRLAIWGVTLRLIADHPLLGVGPGGWKYAYPPYDLGATIRPEASFKNPHNDYLWIAAEFGLIGLGVYGYLLMIAFRCLLKTARAGEPHARLIAVAVAVALLATLGDGCFNFPRARPHAAMYFHLLLGLAAVTTGERNKGQGARVPFRLSGKGDDPVNRPGGGFAFRLVPYICMAISLGAALFSWRRIAFDRYYLRASERVEDLQDWPGALVEAESALRYGLFRPHLLVLKGVALQRLNDFAGAEIAYTQALAFAPYAWQAHADLCALNIQQGRFSDAIAHGQAALELCPGAAFNRYQLGVAYSRTGRDDRAEEAFRAVLETGPFQVTARLRLADICRRRGQPDSAIAYDREVLRLSPEDVQAHLDLSRACLSQGRFQDALTHAQRASQAMPDAPDAHWNLGLALAALGQFDRAEVAYRRVLALQPDFAQAHLALGKLHQMRGNYREAISDYRTYLGGAPGDADDAALVRAWISACEEQLKR